MTPSAPGLADVQTLFWRIITHPTGVRDFLEQCDDATRAQVQAWFDGTPSFSRVERLDVYAQGYFYRLLDTLRELFPLTHWRVGEAAFHNLVTDFLLAHPSRNPDMTHVGDPLPAFIEGHALEQQHSGLGDLARIEHVIRFALDAPDTTPIAPAELAALPPHDWPKLRFAAAPCCKLVSVRVDYEALRKARDAGLAREAVLPAPSTEPHAYVVWRRDFQVWTRRLDPNEANSLRHTLLGESFESIGAHAEAAGLQASNLVLYLMRWTRDGLLVRLP